MSSYNWPASGGGSGIAIYANVAAFPTSGNVVGQCAVDASNIGSIYQWNGSAWVLTSSSSDTNGITALTGDGTASGPVGGGSAALTLATVNASPGSVGSASQSLLATVNAKGLLTSLSAQNILIAESQVTNLVSDLAGKQATGSYITALTGDITGSGPGSTATTLATVNSNVGSFTLASLTVNAKGLVTAASNAGTSGTGNVALVSAPTISNPNINALAIGYTNTVPSGQTITLTASSNQVQVVSGGNGNITYKLPDATTMALGSVFEFWSYKSGGAALTSTIQNAGGSTLFAVFGTVSYCKAILTNNSTSNGVWDTTFNATFLPLASGTTNGNFVLRNSSGVIGASNFQATGTTSGSVSILPQAAAGTWNFNLPITAGSAGDLLTGQGGGATAMTWSTPTSAATASAISKRDANANEFANNYVTNYATIATAGSTTTLSASSAANQYFTGSSNQTITLPVCSTLAQGFEFMIMNNSTGTLTVNSSGNNLVASLAPMTIGLLQCILASGTTAASWNAMVSYQAGGSVTSVGLTVPSFLSIAGSPITTSGTLALTLSGTALPISSGGTNNASLAVTAGGVPYTDGSKLVNVGAGTAGQFLQSNGSSPPQWGGVIAANTNPTIQKLSSGTSYTCPAGVQFITVRMTGAGGGGAGCGGTTAPTGATGGTTSFNSVTAIGGSGGVGSTTANAQLGGVGGTGGTGTANLRIPGQAGLVGPSNIVGTGSAASGAGGASAFGFGGASAGQTVAGNVGQNYGGGGSSGGATAGATAVGGGGGGGEYVELLLAAGNYSYAIGAGGAGGIGTGTNAETGGAGAPGYIEVTEYYTATAIGTTTSISANQILAGPTTGSAAIPTFRALVAADLATIFGAWTSYTPTITAGSGTITSSTATGAYLQIGKTVFIQIKVVITTAGTGAAALMASLPVTAVAGLPAVLAGREDAAIGVMLQGNIEPGGTVVNIFKYDNTTIIVNGYTVYMSGVYQSA